MTLTGPQFRGLQQGDSLLYVAGSGEHYIGAEAFVKDVVDKDRMVVITITDIIKHGSQIDHSVGDEIMATLEELTVEE